MRATRFPETAQGPTERIAGFMAHLRMNGFRAGPRETEDALKALNAVACTDRTQARSALKALLVPDHDGWQRFDDLYDAYWFNTGKQRQADVKADHIRTQSARPTLWRAEPDDDLRSHRAQGAREREVGLGVGGREEGTGDEEQVQAGAREQGHGLEGLGELGVEARGLRRDTARHDRIGLDVTERG